jgi:chemotaxis response regulator CheB
MAKKRTKAATAASRKVKGARAAKTAKPRPARRVEPDDVDDVPGLTIVGVGASAGGLEAFGALLRALPPDPGFALVFVQHLAPQHESALVALLSLKSALPVTEARDGTRVEPNHVYVIAPNTQLVISSA